MSSSRKAKDLIFSEVATLDEEMTTHQENCFKCSEKEPCPIWIEMVETWNFYHISLVRALKNKYIELPKNYETH